MFLGVEDPNGRTIGAVQAELSVLRQDSIAGVVIGADLGLTNSLGRHEVELGAAVARLLAHVACPRDLGTSGVGILDALKTQILIDRSSPTVGYVAGSREVDHDVPLPGNRPHDLIEHIALLSALNASTKRFSGRHSTGLGNVLQVHVTHRGHGLVVVVEQALVGRLAECLVHPGLHLAPVDHLDVDAALAVDRDAVG